MSQWFQSQEADFYDTGYKIWSHSMANVSISEVDMLKNSSTFAVSVPVNYSIKLDFVSVNGPRETYFVGALCILQGAYRIIRLIYFKSQPL